MTIFSPLDVEAAAKAMAIHDGWEGWDTAKDFCDTLTGNDPEHERTAYLSSAQTALTAAIASAKARGAAEICKHFNFTDGEKHKFGNDEDDLPTVLIIRMEDTP